MIGTDSCLGFEVPREALLFVALSYWPEPAKASSGTGLCLLASRADEERAWPGGTEYAKIGPNYGPALRTHGEARVRGYNQVL
jgi:branched-chain amino acid aminotransferase